MTTLPSPLLVPGRITTLVGPPDDEMAALVAALAVSYKTGTPLVPGFVPHHPSDLHVYAYSGNWISWKCLIADICTAAGIATPVIRLRCPDKPLGQDLAVKRDPDADEYWHPLISGDVDAEFAGAKAAGRELPPVLSIVFGVAEAAGGAAEVRRLYEEFRGQGKTALMAGIETDESWIGDFGPVVLLPSLHHSVRWRDILAQLTGGDVIAADHDAVEPETAPVPRASALNPCQSRRPGVLGAVVVGPAFTFGP